MPWHECYRRSAAEPLPNARDVRLNPPSIDLTDAQARHRVTGRFLELPLTGLRLNMGSLARFSRVEALRGAASAGNFERFKNSFLSKTGSLTGLKRLIFRSLRRATTR